MNVYTVKPGDTLKKISKQLLGDAERYKEIAENNNILDPNLISVGMKLQIPAKDAPVLISDHQLKEIVPYISNEALHLYLAPLNEKMHDFEITTSLRIVHFISQVAHESGAFRYNKENLNYSARALRSVFGKYFKTDQEAESYARQPELIASRVYANRLGNGDESSGEGWEYCGRGLIQLTGRDNYLRCGESLGIDLVAQPDTVANDPFCAVAAAAWYWDSRNINKFADMDDVEKVTSLINGGLNGLDDRKQYLVRAKRVFNIS